MSPIHDTIAVGVLSVQRTFGDNSVNLGTRVFLNRVTRFYLTQFFPFTSFNFIQKLKDKNRVITEVKTRFKN